MYISSSEVFVYIYINPIMPVFWKQNQSLLKHI